MKTLRAERESEKKFSHHFKASSQRVVIFIIALRVVHSLVILQKAR
jgi:hypothetical protein